MISAIFIFNYKGDVLISRVYRSNDVGRSAADAFRVHVIHSRHAVRSPVMTIGHTTFFHMYSGEVWVCAVTRQNINAAMVFEFLRKTVATFKNYFGAFNESAIKNNFVLIYELLDEMLDFGFPQRTEPEILKMYITQVGVKAPAGAGAVAPSQLSMQVTGATTWRREGIRYKKNEIFLDVIETVNMLMSSQGKELSADVQGSVMMKAYLSGMPECRFGLNDKISLEKRNKGSGRPGKGGVDIEDISFHQCVRITSAAERGISFVPPDGEFELMRYRTASNIKAPFRVIPIVRDVSKTKMEAKVVLKALYGTNLVANNVIVRLPTPGNTARVKVAATVGKAKYKGEEGAVIWKLKKFQGEQEATLSAEIDLISTTDTKKRDANKAPISLQFQVPMFTASGMQVRFLKVVETKLNYDTVKWVRYLCKNGQYEARITGAQ